jgi:DnaK suppressor protein
MLTDEQRELIQKRLLDAEHKLLQNADSSLRMSMDREADIGRDSIDQSISEEMVSTDLRLRDREKKLLGKIRGAIQRLEEGTIDECEDCGEAIGFKRLLARPVTTLCIHCKESREEQEKREPIETLVASEEVEDQISEE